jgi:hypothetical protein
MNSRRFMGLVLMVEDHTLARRGSETALRIAAKWASQSLQRLKNSGPGYLGME